MKMAMLRFPSESELQFVFNYGFVGFSNIILLGQLKFRKSEFNFFM